MTQVIPFTHDVTSHFTMPPANVSIALTVAEGHQVHCESDWGTLRPNRSVAAAGETVKMTCQPEEALISLTAADEYGNDIALSDDHSFVMPDCDVMVRASFRKSVTYINRTWNGGAVVSEKAVCMDFTTVTGNTRALRNGWYLLNSNVQIDGALSVSGTAHLILADGCWLTVTNGVDLPAGATLHIYGQVLDNGQLNASGEKYHAGIGGGDNNAGGTLVVHGGSVIAKGGKYAAGIGSGDEAPSAGAFISYGGQVSAEGGTDGAAIGGGSDADVRRGYDGGRIIITNGIVTAESFYGAGIGGGGSESGGGGGNGGSVTISGGVVCAASQAKGAGIGGGNDGNGGAVHISGGLVFAVGGYLDYSWVEQNGTASGSVKKAANGVAGAIPGVQGTLDSYIYSVIADMILDMAFSGEYGGAGIGGGDDGNGGTVTISGGSVYACAGMNTARAIGRGDGGSSDGSLTLYDTAKVMAGVEKEYILPAFSDERVTACQSNTYAEIVPCNHSMTTLQDIDWEKHLVISCAFCVGEDQEIEEAHEFFPDTHTCACGHTEHEVTVTGMEGCGAVTSPSPIDGESGRIFVSTGGSFTLETTPDQDGVFPSVTAKYGDENLLPASTEPQDGKKTYIFSPMPDADVVVTLAKGVPRIAANKLILTGVLGLKYYMELPDGYDYSDSTMTFSIPRQPDQTIALNNAGTANGYRVFECKVYAYQMPGNRNGIIRM